MKKILKWLGIVLLSLAVIAIVTAFILINRFNGRMNKVYNITVEKINIIHDSVTMEKGKVFVPLCQSCHGEALQGKVFFSNPKIGTIYSPNLTRGDGGIGKSYTDEDWVRSIRHGINPEGKALIVMPAKDLHNLSSEDLAALIAYVKNVPPVDNKKGENIMPRFTKILMQLGMFGEILSAEVINHEEEFKPAPVKGVSTEYGDYIVRVSGCRTCHGKQLAGGKSPDPKAPLAPNLTPAGLLNKWTDKDFVTTLRTGVTPEKKVLNDTFMPWKHLGQMPDDHLQATFKYLQSLPKTATQKP